MKSPRLIEWLLRLYPAAFRERYGPAMRVFHEDRAREGTGLLSWLGIIADHVVSASAEHLRLRRRQARLLVRPGCLSTSRLATGTWAASSLASPQASSEPRNTPNTRKFFPSSTVACGQAWLSGGIGFARRQMNRRDERPRSVSANSSLPTIGVLIPARAQ